MARDHQIRSRKSPEPLHRSDAFDGGIAAPCGLRASKWPEPAFTFLPVQG
jgi:hypothetical protein